MSDLENLFVIYPPHLGGNHLANLISLDQKYTRRFDLESYDQNVSNAHFSYIREINLDQIRANLDQLKTQSNVFCGHYLEYLKFRRSDLVDYFPNRKFLAIQIPEPAAVVAYTRMIGQNPKDIVPYLYKEIATVYQLPNIRMLCHEVDRPWYSVTSDLLFDPDISKLFKDLAQRGLEIDIDMDLIQTLHTKWFNRL